MNNVAEPGPLPRSDDVVELTRAGLLLGLLGAMVRSTAGRPARRQTLG